VHWSEHLNLNHINLPPVTPPKKEKEEHGKKRLAEITRYYVTS